MNKLVRGYCFAIVVGALFLAGEKSGRGQDAPPSPPYVAPLPARITWVLKFDSASGQTPDPKMLELVEQEGSQTGTICQEINTWSNGQTSETWISNGIYLIENPVQHDVLLLTPSGGKVDDYVLRYEISRLPWLSPDTYVRTEAHAGHSCHWFKKSPHAPPAKATTVDDLDLGFGAPSAEAWIDAATRQVAGLKVGSHSYTIVYGPAPASDLVLPPKFNNVLKPHLEMMDPNARRIPPHF